ncbi:MAG: YbaK/EbsC family protein [Betaproteobacteria bacterium]|nr:MAG: YbaK/EbsC family protein [Betaproteobacteria bacterium]TMH66305.1 MAG: YbaK/EbsC family protein [Betaproteobacteria bacterium]
MATASRVEDYMMRHGVHCDVLTHPHSHSSMETAELARVPGDRVAKSVILEDDDGYVMAVLPSTYHVRLGKLSRELNRRLRLATEDELARLFTDCETGAIPPLGLAYGMPTIVDDSLALQSEIYCEGGDHETLLHMNRDAFMALMEHADHARFARRG